MALLFTNLESTDPLVVEEAKKELSKTFNQTKDTWVVYGMMDYYSHSNSTRIVDVLVRVQTPHDIYIFDKLLEWVNLTNRNQAFNLFWHIVKKHPSWLHKVASHPLFKEMLKVLKVDTNIVTVINALFCVIILLPIIPTSMPQYLNDIFETFMHLATWRAENRPELTTDQQIHLQIGISTLFQRLYGMFPCNFTFYIRDHIKDSPLAYETIIIPLLETVKMHHLLLTSNRESEKSVSRWKEKEPHDVVIECSRYSFEGAVKVPDTDSEQQNENAWLNLLVTDEEIFPMNQRAKCSQKIEHIWSPSNTVLATPPPTNSSTITHTPTPTIINPNYSIQTISSGQYSCSGASPPEAAVEATPETTPMKDFVKTPRPFPTNSTAVRTIWANTSQPSSPRKKEDNSVEFGYTENPTSSHLFTSKLTKLVNDRQMAKLYHDRNMTTIEGNSSSDVFEIEIQGPLNKSDEKEDEEVTQIIRSRIDEKGDSTVHPSQSPEKLSQPVKGRQININDSTRTNKRGVSDDDVCIALSCAGFKRTLCDQLPSKQETLPISPHLLLDQYIEASIKKQSSSDLGVNRSVELHLLYLQLQYERYRREVHAERNRRLLGKSRDNAALKKDNDKLRYESDRLSKEITAMTSTLNDTKISLNVKQQEYFQDCERLRNEIRAEQTKNNDLQLELDAVKETLTHEKEQKKEMMVSLEAARADIFDLKHLLRLREDQAEIGMKYKEDLQHMHAKEILMNELQIKLNEKMIELSNLRARDGEMESMRHSFMGEVEGLQSALDFKSSQLSTTEERLILLQQQHVQRGNLLADHKRNLQMVKEEFEEKLKAIESKYVAQKAVVLRLEETILDLHKMKSIGSMNIIVAESDKTDFVGSLDHTSPLSMSLASSEGLSLSLRSVPDIRNLSQLVSENVSTSNSLFSQPNGVSMSTEKSKQTVSDDIPVPSTSHAHYYQ